MTRPLDRSLLQAALLANLATANLLLNGFHLVSQEVTQGTGVTSSKYPADQWLINTPLAGAYANQVGTPFPSLPDLPLGLKFTAPTAGAVAAGDVSQLFQPLEGTFLQKLAYGTTKARTVTMAFMLRASYTGVGGFSIWNANANRSWVKRLPFNANEDTFFCFQVPGDVASALLASNGLAASARWAFGVGASFQAATLEGWVAGNMAGPVDTSNVGAVAGQSVTIGACVMLPGKVNLTADLLPQLVRRADDELRLCQRYYRKQGMPAIVDNGGQNGYGFRWDCVISPSMRTNPSTAWTSGASNSNVASFVLETQLPDMIGFAGTYGNAGNSQAVLGGGSYSTLNARLA